MVNADEEAIEIPIEFVPKDLRELKKVKDDVDQIERKVKKIKDTSSGQAVPTLDDDRGGIFGGSPKIRGKGIKIQTGSVGAPAQRKNVVLDKLSRLEKAQKKADKVLSGFQKGAGFLPIVGGGPLNAMKGLAFKMIPFIGAALVAKGIIQGILGELLRDGGFLDRRLKIFNNKQFLQLTKRNEAAQLSRGFRSLIVTSSIGLRGPTSQIFNTQQAVKKGMPLLAENQESISKGVLPT